MTARKGDLEFSPESKTVKVGTNRSKTANFTGYTADGFTEADQRRLAERARHLKERGAHVLLTNSDAPFVRELYPEPFWKVERVEVRGDALNTDGAKRGKVGELIIS